MKKILFMIILAAVCTSASAAIKPSTVDNPIWYQLKNGNNYLGWMDWGAIYAKLEGVNPNNIDNTDKLEWAFIPSGDGYKLLNKANGQYLGVRENYVNLSEEGVVWTVTETDDYLTLKFGDDNLYDNYFVMVGTKSPVKFTPIEIVEETPTFIFTDLDGNEVSDGSVIVVNTLNEDGKMVVPLKARNVSGEKMAVSMYENIDAKPSGEWETCAFGNYMQLEATGYSSKSVVAADYDSDIQTEWIPVAGLDATWEATLQIHIFNIADEVAGDEVIAYGPTVTVRFEYVDTTPGSTDIKPSTADDPVWYQIKRGDDYLGWTNYGAVYAKLKGVTPNNVDDTDKLEWAFISTGDGYKLLNKANGLYLGVREKYVNLNAEGVVWTVTQTDDYLTLKCDDGNLYDDDIFLMVGTRSPEKFTVKEIPSEATAISSVNMGQDSTVVYDLSGRRIAQHAAKGLYVVNGRLVLMK